MKKIFIIIISLSFSLSMYSQVKYTVTDSTFVRGHKFLLIETEDGVAEIKAFYKGVEKPVSGVIKMAPPVYFIRKYKSGELSTNDFIMEKREVFTVLMIVGNEASKCDLESVDLKKIKDEFCGTHVQGIIISSEGISFTEFMYNSHVYCTKTNGLNYKYLSGFAYCHFDMNKKKKKAKKKGKKQQ